MWSDSPLQGAVWPQLLCFEADCIACTKHFWALCTSQGHAGPNAESCDLVSGPMALPSVRTRCQVLLLLQRLVHSIHQDHSPRLPPSLRLDLLDMLLDGVRQASAANRDSSFLQLLGELVAAHQPSPIPTAVPHDQEVGSPFGSHLPPYRVGDCCVGCAERSLIGTRRRSRCSLVCSRMRGNNAAAGVPSQGSGCSTAEGVQECQSAREESDPAGETRPVAGEEAPREETLPIDSEANAGTPDSEGREAVEGRGEGTPGDSPLSASDEKPGTDADREGQETGEVADDAGRKPVDDPAELDPAREASDVRTPDARLGHSGEEAEPSEAQSHQRGDEDGDQVKPTSHETSGRDSPQAEDSEPSQSESRSHPRSSIVGDGGPPPHVLKRFEYPYTPMTMESSGSEASDSGDWQDELPDLRTTIPDAGDTALRGLLRLEAEGGALAISALRGCFARTGEVRGVARTTRHSSRTLDRSTDGMLESNEQPWFGLYRRFELSTSDGLNTALDTSAPNDFIAFFFPGGTGGRRLPRRRDSS